MSLYEIIRTLLIGYPITPEMIDPNYPAWIQQIGGLALTSVVTICSLLVGIPFGLALAISRRDTHRRIGAMWLLHGPSTAVIEVIRGIPVMVLVLLVFYLPYRLLAIRVPAVVLAIIALSLYSGVYLSEIFRSGFRAVDRHWIDAAKILGLTKSQILLEIKLPIATQAMLPDFLGLAITVFKDTSVLVVVAVPELTYCARQMQVAEPINYTLVMGLVLVLYWSIATAGSVLCNRIEKTWARPLAV